MKPLKHFSRKKAIRIGKRIGLYRAKGRPLDLDDMKELVTPLANIKSGGGNPKHYWVLRAKVRRGIAI